MLLIVINNISWYITNIATKYLEQLFLYTLLMNKVENFLWNEANWDVFCIQFRGDKRDRFEICLHLEYGNNSSFFILSWHFIYLIRFSVWTILSLNKQIQTFEIIFLRTIRHLWVLWLFSESIYTYLWVYSGSPFSNDSLN